MRPPDEPVSRHSSCGVSYGQCACRRRGRSGGRAKGLRRKKKPPGAVSLPAAGGCASPTQVCGRRHTLETERTPAISFTTSAETSPNAGPRRDRPMSSRIPWSLARWMYRRVSMPEHRAGETGLGIEHSLGRNSKLAGRRGRCAVQMTRARTLDRTPANPASPDVCSAFAELGGPPPPRTLHQHPACHRDTRS